MLPESGTDPGLRRFLDELKDVVERDNEGTGLAAFEHDPNRLNGRGDRDIEATLPVELLAQDWEHDHELAFSKKTELIQQGLCTTCIHTFSSSSLYYLVQLGSHDKLRG